MLRMEWCIVRLAKGGDYCVFSIQFGGGIFQTFKKIKLILGNVAHRKSETLPCIIHSKSQLPKLFCRCCLVVKVKERKGSLFLNTSNSLILTKILIIS